MSRRVVEQLYRCWFGAGNNIVVILLVQEFVEQASGQLVGLYPELIGAVLPNISHPNKDIQQVRHLTSVESHFFMMLWMLVMAPEVCCEPACCTSAPAHHEHSTQRGFLRSRECFFLRCVGQH